MSTEPLTAHNPGTTADSEQGLLLAILLMVVLGVGAIFLIS
ncbi:MAG TPA: hypothetical protein VF755_04235 [Catenuloplanes sp.]|jgi:hypothetical protein